MNGIVALGAFVAGFTIAQIAKMMIVYLKSRGQATGREVLAWSFKSGGMPSGHAASFVALATLLGLEQGVNSPIFALSVAMVIVIIYDATNVRYAVGEHGKILNKLIDDYNCRNRHARTGKMKQIKLVEGHKLSEVVVGIWLGVVIGLSFYIIF